MKCKLHCNDPTRKENLKQVMPQTEEVFNGLLNQFSKRKQCIRPRIKVFQSKEIPDQERLNSLIAEATKRIAIRQEINKILWEEEQNAKREKCKRIEPVEYFTHPCKCESKYDWSYIKGQVGDAKSSPSLISLRSYESYIALPRPAKEDKIKALTESNISCDEDFIEYPEHGRRILSKRLPPDKELLLKTQIDYLENKFMLWKKKKKRDYSSKIKRRKLTLFDKIMLGYEPDLECRADLISLFDKVKPPAPKLPKDVLLTCRDCNDFYENECDSPFYRPNTYRQNEVLSRYTPADHNNLSLKKRLKLAKKILALKSINYYGTGPTLWKCERIDDTWLTTGPRKIVCAEPLPYTCPEKPKADLMKVKKALDYPSFLVLSVSDRRIIKCSWQNRGISKSTLIMLWFDKLFRRDPDSLHLQMPGQSIDALFLDEDNLKYIDQLATLLDMTMKFINKPDIATKLICEIGYVHSCLDVKDTLFETLKETLLETFRENFHPKLTKIQLDAWKRFIEIMFDLVHHCFLWNKWPPTDFCGTKEMMAVQAVMDESLRGEGYQSSTISVTMEEKLSTVGTKEKSVASVETIEECKDEELGGEEREYVFDEEVMGGEGRESNVFWAHTFTSLSQVM